MDEGRLRAFLKNTLLKKNWKIVQSEPKPTKNNDKAGKQSQV